MSLLFLGRLELDLLVANKDTLALVRLGLTVLANGLCKLPEQFLVGTSKFDDGRRRRFSLDTVGNRE